MAYNEKFTAEIEINSQKAQSNLKNLKSELEDLRKKQLEAYRLGTKEGKAEAEALQKRINITEKAYKQEERHVKGLNMAMKKLSKTGYEDLRKEVIALNKLMRDGTVEKGSREWKALAERVRAAREEMRTYTDAVAEQESAWQRFFGFLNDSWGGLVILFQSVAQLRMTIAGSVNDFAAMEEEMADVRKYTGLTDEAVRDLNEDLKKMDTRTAREELNQLAGAAGRLGKTSKEDILDFVEAGNMIKVALGDDLGEGAIDKVGKLAMAFGEDEKMGLRGAMLATGSAVNELAQNSPAQAGYLVDFTARVAGFGKQLGLTQAQIMGFGAVMDENMLRDEMAATAFGNMLTKMQTDTEKFARIAGMDIKQFTDLLNKDANAAVLALADNLKKADPQTMMKMLDDMGLDGSRAVGVLSTLADKIDDVRARQELATKAYNEGISVEKEYNTMNNTVQAGIEKAKKQFHEISVELGERLLPVVRYTISYSSMIVKVLSTIISLVVNNIGVIAKLTVVLAEYLAIKKLNYLWTQRNIAIEATAMALRKAQAAGIAVLTAAEKALTVAQLSYNGAIKKTTALQWLLTKAWKASPIGWVTTGVVALTAGIYKLATALSEENRQRKIGNDLAESAIQKAADEKTKIASLVETARNQNEELSKRKQAIEQLNAIIPGYNGQLDETTGKYNENSEALRTYNSLLLEKYRLEAAEGKIKDIERKKFEEDLRYEEKMRKARENEGGRNSFVSRWLRTQGTQAAGSDSTKGYQEQLTRDHEKRMSEYDAELNIVKGIRDNTKEIVDFNNTLNRTLENQRKVLEGDTVTNTTGGGNTTYTPEGKKKKGGSSDTEKKERREHLQQLREDASEEKAIMDGRLADNMLAYSAGLKTYRQFITDQQRIREEGLQAQMEVWKDEPEQYEKLRLQLVALQKNGDQDLTRMRLDDIEREHRMVIMKLEAGFQDEQSTYYQNETALNEALFRADMTYLEKKKNLYRKGSFEAMQIEDEIQEQEQRHQLEQQERYQQTLNEVKNRYLQMGDKERETLELNALEELKKKKLLKEEEYQQARIAIEAQYASNQSVGDQTRQTASDMLKKAQSEANGSSSSSWDIPIVGSIQQYSALMEQLKLLYGQDEQNHAAYLEAKRQATAQFCQNMASQMQAAFSSVSSMMSAVSNYYGAQSDYEVAVTKKKYEKQIAAAGNNQAKIKKLQEKQAKEEAAIKTKYNRKQVKIQIAQALAQTAMNALNAYGSAAAIPVIGYILAPIAAAMAVAAGMLQIAAIKKQAAAQEAGYYEGGFTGGNRYRKEAGVVHEGEFVANHQAVSNPNLLPMLEMIDRAQRNNTVGSLSREDIARQIGQGGSVVAPVVNINNDNEEMRQSAEQMTEAAVGLRERLNTPIPCYVVLDGPDGLVAQLKHLEKLKKI